MTQQYLRQVSLVVANSGGKGFDFGKFWCTFSVKRGDFQTPNSLDARIYNVAPATVAKISKNEFTTISLSAGYPGSVGLLFQGSIKQFRAGRVNQVDSYVDITAADSDQAYNYAFMTTTVPAGTTAGSLTDLIQASFKQHSPAQQITQGYTPPLPQPPSVRGEVLFGMTRDIARDFANQNNCKWSLQDGGVTYIPWNNFIPSGEIPLISVKTGLVNVPEQTQAGISIRTLLNSAIKVGQLIKLDTNAINQFRFGLDSVSGQVSNVATALQNKLNSQGLYYVMVVNHTGDTRGQNWYTDLVCLAVDATVTNVPQGSQIFNTATAAPIQRYGGT